MCNMFYFCWFLNIQVVGFNCWVMARAIKACFSDKIGLLLVSWFELSVFFVAWKICGVILDLVPTSPFSLSNAVVFWMISYIYINIYIYNLHIKYALRWVICKTLVIACFKIVAGFILRFMAKRNRIWWPWSHSKQILMSFPMVSRWTPTLQVSEGELVEVRRKIMGEPTAVNH